MFDPFMYLTVPIAEPKKNVVVLFIPRSLDKYPVKVRHGVINGAKLQILLKQLLLSTLILITAGIEFLKMDFNTQ